MRKIMRAHNRIIQRSLICMERGADLHMAQLMPLPLPLTVSCFSKIHVGLPVWYQLTWVVLDKGPLNGCVRMCVHVVISVEWFDKVDKMSCVYDCRRL